jgi:ABC-2 type transport system ATP-binding protein
MTVNPVLDAQQIRKSFGKLVAVDSIDLRVEAGQCLALLGPNGAGKTTCVEILEGLQSPDSGSIKILGMDYTTQRRQILEKIGVTLQETRLYKRFTTRETLELFASFFKLNVSIDGLIKTLGLEEKADVRLHKLSGGQKQRVYIGCALVNSPELLFLDEPTSGLDPQARRFVWELLNAQKKSGKSLLLTTHFMDEAQTLADQVAIMDRGKIIAQGSVADLVRSYTPEMELSIVHENLDASEQQQISQRVPGLWTNSSFTAKVRDSAAVLSLIAPILAQFGDRIKQVSIRAQTLEDVFLKITGRSLRDD